VWREREREMLPRTRIAFSIGRDSCVVVIYQMVVEITRHGPAGRGKEYMNNSGFFYLLRESKISDGCVQIANKKTACYSCPPSSFDLYLFLREDQFKEKEKGFYYAKSLI
jgi:hypothetical protein